MAKEFYDDLAESFHLIFQDWEASLRYQADVLARLLPPQSSDMPILDCACGIGTQAIGLAMKGYRVEGRDPSPASIGRASREAAVRGLTANFRIDDMRNLSTAALGGYGAVLGMDKEIPHLRSDAAIVTTLSCVVDRLWTHSVILLTQRTWCALLTRCQ